MEFTKASKKSSRLRMAITGISNSGKTWTSLAIAAGLGGPVALIDTERGSASKYAEYFAFDVLELEDFHPEKYIEAIELAGNSGFAVCITDSLSHAWVGEGGALDLVNDKTRGSDSANSYFAWREITPLQNRLIEAILRSPCHVICTLRSKADYVIERDNRGKNVPKKIGLAPIQRQGLEYEFDLFGVMDDEHILTITKSRFPRIAGPIKKPGISFGKILAEELSGTVLPRNFQEEAAKAAADLFGDGAGDRMRQHQANAEIGAITQLWVGYGLTPAQIDNYWDKQCRRFAVSAPGDIPELDRRYKEVAQWIAEHPSDSDERASETTDTPGQHQEDEDDIPEFSPSSAEGETHA